MTVTVASPPRTVVQRPSTWRGLRLSTVYAVSLGLWLITRWLVLVHQGAWPWMNAFVVAAARGIVVGDWNEAVRPQLPAVLGVPLVLLGASEQQVVAALYIVASLVQLGAFIVLVRAVFPDAVLEQSLALLIFLLVPYNHSIHHYRDVPVVLASSAVFLLAAHWIRAPRGVTGAAWLVGAMFLGLWSRAEVLTFVGALLLLGLLFWRGQALRRVGLYAAAAVVAVAALLAVFAWEGVDLAEASRYQWHTFLDSTPESWLTEECRDAPTENCRERDGLTYFGPAAPEGGVVPMLVNHPLLATVKTARSALDNLWIMLGPNLSTLPGSVPFVVLVLALAPAARAALRVLPPAAWMVVAAIVAETVLPPLSWAPPHPQYHLQLVAALTIVVVPLLMALARTPRGRLLATGFLIANATLSALRYTRYPGY